MKMTITIENDYNAEALSVFCKRVTFDDAYRRAHGETKADRKAMSYRILDAIANIETGLEKAGFSTR
jgi:hypothetical protein